ncbi:uncharacterized protein with ParB-like and HNH nuclease domain/predicted transport protein [Deinobacterium chartae]|uniref:Uncharacterized protein with ParB-like and HNH nuclease domain/predicted transport protein n=1 Tax=Deinobacterium chartae TaxID=521158 RepID=A0A841HZ03_9DEIO|nr:DUF262 and DUF1524 domain-containing protein [Deinobacterium chartae]MBB6097904.1 uncharacterized protein with ParB-like and HNH nuclease domain/predicted transport protein [Deinobacterium chartae]
MKAKESKLLKFLQGEKQFLVPIYQRKYSWQRAQCEQYWNDLLMAGRSERVQSHFLGAVVYIGHGVYSASDVSQLLVIDGQQRLTTTTLLMIALARALDAGREIFLETGANDGTITTMRVTASRIRENYLVNRHEEGSDSYHKLLLTSTDRDALRRLVDGAPLADAPSTRLLENLAFFEERLRTPDLDLRDVYKGLQKLVIVDVALEQGHDNPQLIFESMNSTGLDLSQADLIRNYVLMGLEPKEQTRLYRTYWSRMEALLSAPERQPDDFDRFVRDYLSLRGSSSVPARLKDVYAAFKKHVQTQPGLATADLVSDLHTAAVRYAALLDPQRHEADPEVRRALLDLHALELDVWYPFGLHAYGAWQGGHLDKPEFLQVLRLLESYLFRRWVSGLGTQGLNKFFPALPAQLDESAYLDSFRDVLYAQRSYLRFPHDEEFKRGLTTRSIYTPRHLCRYTLRKLENDGHKEPVNPANYTIEHILPQNEDLSEAWREMLGPDWRDVQDRYLHTLGNLTLTGYNSELSDRPFLEKRDMPGGFKDSHLRLNHELAGLDGWDAERIEARANRLAEQATRVWPMVQPTPELLARVQARREERSERTVEDHLRGTSPELRELFDELREALLGMHPNATEIATSTYVAYKVGTNFCDVQIRPGVSRLVVWLNLPFKDLNDPLGLARDVSRIGHNGNGEAEVTLEPGVNLDAFLSLAQQALERHLARRGTERSSSA